MQDFLPSPYAPLIFTHLASHEVPMNLYHLATHLVLPGGAMRKALLLVALAVVSGGATAKWVETASNDQRAAVRV